MCSLRRELRDVVAGVVRVAAFHPLICHGDAVHGERRDVAHPHADGGVGLPTVLRDDQRAEDLECFDALFAEP